MEDQKEAELAQDKNEKKVSQTGKNETEKNKNDKRNLLKLEEIKNPQMNCLNKIRKKSTYFTPVIGEKKRWSVCSPEPRALPLEVMKLLTPCRQVENRNFNRKAISSLQ